MVAAPGEPKRGANPIRAAPRPITRPIQVEIMELRLRPPLTASLASGPTRAAAKIFRFRRPPLAPGRRPAAH